MQDPVARHLLLLLDGTRDHGQIGDDLFAALQREGALPAAGNEPQLLNEAKSALIAELPNNLAKMARLGFLIE
jgi:hypothetical protein